MKDFALRAAYLRSRPPSRVYRRFEIVSPPWWAFWRKPWLRIVEASETQ